MRISSTTPKAISPPRKSSRHARAKMPGVNKSTVYRTLDLLEGAGCVFKSELGDQFIYHHADEGHHHHLVCRKCGKTIECEEDFLAPVESRCKSDTGSTSISTI